MIASEQMSTGKRRVFLCAALLLHAASAASNYGANVAMPGKVSSMGAMDFYSLNGAAGTVGMTLVLPIIGKLCDMFGTKMVALFGVALQFISYICMIFTTSFSIFLVARVTTSVGVGMYLSTPFTMIAEVTQLEERPKYYGMLVTFKSFGALLGPLVAGQLVDNGYTSLSFIAYTPYILLSVPFIIALYPNRKLTQTSGIPVDFVGIFLLVFSLCSIILLLNLAGKLFAWVSPISAVLLIIGVLGMIILVRHETQHPNPSVAIRMFKKRRFTVAFLSMFMVTAFSTTFSAYVIVYMQQIMQVSTVVSSTGSMPMTISQAIFGVIFGSYLGNEFPKRFRPAALFSLILVAIGALALCFLQPMSSMAIIYLSSTLGGIGTVVPQSAFSNFFQTELKPEEIGAAQGMFSFGSCVGSCIFMAITGVIMNAGGNIYHAFYLSAAFCIAALVIGFVGLHLPSEASELHSRQY